MARTGIFGGSFNPVHSAHLALAERVRQARGLDRVLFVPALHPPHKLQEPLATPRHRVRMLELATGDRPGLEVSTVELDRAGPSYMLLTVRQIRQELGADEEIFLVVGADMLADIPAWWHADELVREAGIIAVARSGTSLEEGFGGLERSFGPDVASRARDLVVEMPRLDVSSTDVRERICAGRSIRRLVPDAVAEYILANGLYAGG